MTMLAGRELDALIADKVMGWTVRADGWIYGRNCFLVDDHAGEDQTWSPSRSIAAAWEVVEQLKADCHMIDVMSTTPGWRCRIDCMHDDYTEVRAMTAPLAICLAALKALNMEVPS